MRKGIRILTVLSALCAAGCGPNFKDVANLSSTGANIICLGDSITRGFGATNGMDYPAQLSALLGRPVINAGADGDTSADALKRLRKDVLNNDPWIVIVTLGGNDFLQKVSKNETAENLEEIVSQCVAANAIVVLVHCKFGILMSDPYWDTHQSLSENHNTMLVKNTLRGILGTPSRMYDPIHPNDAGYRIIAERVAKVVAPLAEASEKARGDG